MEIRLDRTEDLDTIRRLTASAFKEILHSS